MAEASILPWTHSADFEVTGVTIGAVSVAPLPLMIDDNGDGLHDVEKAFWEIDNFGGVLAATGNTLVIVARRQVTQEAPAPVDPVVKCLVNCCVVM